MHKWKLSAVGVLAIASTLAGCDDYHLKTWTNYTGFDPETNLGGGSNVTGVDYFNNPQTRQWILSVGLNR